MSQNQQPANATSLTVVEILPNAVGTAPIANFSPPIPVMFSRPCGLFDSTRTAATPSCLKNSLRARVNSLAAAKGGGATGSPARRGGGGIILVSLA